MCVRAQKLNNIWMLELIQEVEIVQLVLVIAAVLIVPYELLPYDSLLLL